MQQNTDQKQDESDNVDLQQRLTVALNKLAEFEQMAHEHQLTLENLYLHQEELRTQNEELRQAQSNLENARRRHQELFDYSPVAQFLVSSNGLILKTNRAADSMLALKAYELFNFQLQNLTRIHSDRSKLLNFVKEISEQKFPSPINIELIRRDGKCVKIQMHGSRSGAVHETSVLLTAIDNTASQELEYEKNKRLCAETLAQTITNHWERPVFMVDNSWQIVRCNDAFTQLTGISITPDNAIPLLTILGTRYRDTWAGWVALQNRNDWQGKTEIVDANGGSVPIKMSLIAIIKEREPYIQFLAICDRTDDNIVRVGSPDAINCRK